MNTSRPAAWLQLLRAPNLLTVPGDPLAGFLLVREAPLRADSKLLLAVAASLAFYGAGLFMNDLADVGTDRCERPSRPLPSGRVPARHAFIGCVILLAAGVASSALIGRCACGVSAALILAITLYNLVLKDVPVLGALTMGLCRGLSLFLGVTAATAQPPFPLATLAAALLLALFIASVTAVARHEVTSARVGILRWFPALALLSGAILFLQTIRWDSIFAIVIFALVLAVLVQAGRRLGDGDAPVPLAIGLWISLLMWIQASFAVAAGSVTVGVVLLVGWTANRILARRFYAS